MTKPGFRKSRPAASRAAGGESDAFLGSSLFSQAQILHLMKAEFARARRHGAPLSCVVLQVDRLAQLVDLYGAPLRTAVRKTLAEVVRQKTRGSDLLGVANEDRMLLLLPETPHEGAMLVVERLLRSFRDVDVEVDGRRLSLTMSAGVSTVQGKETMFFDTLLAQAETAVERATEAGGDRVVSFGQVSLAEGMAEPPADGASGGDPAANPPQDGERRRAGDRG